MARSSHFLFAFAVLVISIVAGPTTPSVADIQILHHFTGGDDGRNPAFRLVPYESDLVGVTRYFSDATIFRIRRDGSGIETLNTFTRGDDTWPVGVTVSGSQLFGMVEMLPLPEAGSAVFRFSPSDMTYDRIHSFEEFEDEGRNYAGLLSASGSTLFGTITQGLSDPTATLFKVNSDGSGYQPLHEFVSGIRRLGGPVVSGDYVYGITTFTAPDTPATLYRVRTDGSGFQTLHTFNDMAGEGYFASDFVVAGSTIYGGVGAGFQTQLGSVPGSIYKLGVDGSGFEVLHFPPDGGGANSLVLDGTTLYGVTDQPTGGSPSIFQINTDGFGYQELHEFSLFPGTLTLTLLNGQLFGTTSHIGRHGMGTIFTIPTEWNADGGGNWSTATNWSRGVPNAAWSAAVLGAVSTSPSRVTVDVPFTLGHITFDNTHAYTLAGPGPLTLNAVSEATIDVVTGSHVIETPITLADDTLITVTPVTSSLTIGGPFNASGVNVTKAGAGTLRVDNVRALGLSIQSGTVAIATSAAGAATGTSVVTSLAIAGDETPAATLDLANNAAIINYTGNSPVAMVREQLVAGRGGPGLGSTWNGTGITSSTAQAANTVEPESRSVAYAENSALPLGPYTTFRGQPVDDTSILIAFTRTGDANLDGVVNDDDVTIVSAAYAPGVPQPSWALGDFDYNGFVDDDDVTLLGAFYDPSAAPLNVTATTNSSVVAAVPEPSTWALFVFATSILIVKRRSLSD